MERNGVEGVAIGCVGAFDHSGGSPVSGSRDRQLHMGGKEVILEGLSPHSDEIAMRIDAWLTQNLK
jgi:hypothetical protein